MLNILEHGVILTVTTTLVLVVAIPLSPIAPDIIPSVAHFMVKLDCGVQQCHQLVCACLPDVAIDVRCIINPRPEGYGSRFVILFTALQRAVLTSSRQLRYEQAKHVDGLQSTRGFC